jgi:hypothetical protein
MMQGCVQAGLVAQSPQLPLLLLLLHKQRPASHLDALCDESVDWDQRHTQQQASNERNPHLQAATHTHTAAHPCEDLAACWCNCADTHHGR